jgi:hypothetical protein
VCARVFARCRLQRLVKARLRAVYCRARLQLLGMGARKWRAQSICSALVRRFTARKFTAAAGDALSGGVFARGWRADAMHGRKGLARGSDARKEGCEHAPRGRVSPSPQTDSRKIWENKIEPVQLIDVTVGNYDIRWD